VRTIGISHVIANRSGDSFGHDLTCRGAPPSRARLELRHFQGCSHGSSACAHRCGPDAGLNSAQYDRLALIYTLASIRAGQWLIPAFHAVIDGDIRGGHDDPQNFDLDSFAHSLEMLLDRLSRTEEPNVLLIPGAE
jgi:hypothetical protein